MRKKIKSRKINKTDTKKALKMLVASLCFGLFTIVIILIAKNSPKFTNGIYSKWSVWMMDTMSKAFSFVKFSVAEILIYLLAIILTVSLIILIKNLIKNRGRLGRLFKFITAWLLVLSIGIFLFYSMWGCMYYSDGLTGELILEVKDREVEELIALNKYLIEKANQLSAEVKRNEQGYYTGNEFNEMARLSAKAVSDFTNKQEALPKYVIASNAWSYTQTTGIFTFLTGEANINSNNLAIAVPFTCAHELAHRNGITSEDEANFFAFYTLIKSDNINMRYSAYSMALIFSMNSLYSKDAQSHRQLSELYSDHLRNDYDRYSEHWDRYDGKVAEISDKANDAYLKAQGETDGVQSYGKVTDILLAWYEKDIDSSN